MQVIIPAILPKSQKDLEEKVHILYGRVQMVQIDSVDGRFISPASWPYLPETPALPTDYELPFVGDMRYEMDLMVSDPESVAGMWIAAGAERIVVHVESTNYLQRVIKDLEVRYGHAKDFAPDLLSLGLAINIGSDLALIEPFLDHADYVQFMGIGIIGKQGQPFDPRVLTKIAAFKKKYPDMTVQVDGGVSLTTAPALLSAGVDRLIVGSALWNAPNIPEELQKFEELIKEYGIYS